MKKIYLVFILILISSFLVACGNEKNLSDEKAKEYVSFMLNEECTFLESFDRGVDKVYNFKDSRGNEFNIVSHLSRKNFDGIFYWKYYESTHSNYIPCLVKGYEKELREIFKKYDLERFCNLEIFNEKLDSIYRDRVTIRFEIPFEEDKLYEEDIDKFVNCSIDIINLLDFNYTRNYIEEEKPDFYIIYECIKGDDDHWFKIELDASRDVEYSKEYIKEVFVNSLEK